MVLMPLLLVLLVVLLALLLALRWCVRCGGLHWSLPHASLPADALSQRWTLVTGATVHSIGGSVAEGLVRAGSGVVVVASVRLQEAEQLCVHIRSRLVACTVTLLPVQLDLRSAASLRQLLRLLTAKGCDELSVVCMCAGVNAPAHNAWAVNFVGTANLTLLLRRHNLIKRGSRVIYAASDSHQIGHVDLDDFDLQKRWGSLVPSLATFWQTQKAYGTSKLMLICWVQALVDQCDGDGVYYALAQPGCVNTFMGEEHESGMRRLLVRALKTFFFKTPWEGAQTILHVATDPTAPKIHRNGGAWANNAPWKFWNDQIEDKQLRMELWNRIEETFEQEFIEK